MTIDFPFHALFLHSNSDNIFHAYLKPASSSGKCLSHDEKMIDRIVYAATILFCDP